MVFTDGQVVAGTPNQLVIVEWHGDTWQVFAADLIASSAQIGEKP
jgi:hypothetical protein